jgi:hypothetical protein
VYAAVQQLSAESGDSEAEVLRRAVALYGWVQLGGVKPGKKLFVGVDLRHIDKELSFGNAPKTAGETHHD